MARRAEEVGAAKVAIDHGRLFALVLLAGGGPPPPSALSSPREQLIDALLSAPGTLSTAETVFGITGSAVVTVFTLTRRHRLVIRLVSPDPARTSGINGARLDLLFLMTFALTVAPRS